MGFWGKVAEVGKKVVGKAYDVAKKNPDAVLGGAAIAKGAWDARSAGKKQDAALKRVGAGYEERAPLRKAGVAGMLAASERAGRYRDRGNPFSR